MLLFDVYASMRCKLTKLATDVRDQGRLHLQQVTYITLIHVLVRQREFDRATDLFRDMKMSAATSGLVTFSTLTKGYNVLGDLEHGQLLG